MTIRNCAICGALTRKSNQVCSHCYAKEQKNKTMATEWEYKTTHGFVASYDRNAGPIGPADPVPPEGSGWEFIGAACDDTYQYWYWKRV